MRLKDRQKVYVLRLPTILMVREETILKACLKNSYCGQELMRVITLSLTPCVHRGCICHARVMSQRDDVRYEISGALGHRCECCRGPASCYVSERGKACMRVIPYWCTRRQLCVGVPRVCQTSWPQQSSKGKHFCGCLCQEPAMDGGETPGLRTKHITPRRKGDKHEYQEGPSPHLLVWLSLLLLELPPCA